jgi:hypothetical protein
MVTPWALLLFGGELEVKHTERLVLVDKWIRFAAQARVGVLVKALREELDALLSQKVEFPDLDVHETRLFVAIEELLQSDGM